MRFGLLMTNTCWPNLNNRKNLCHKHSWQSWSFRRFVSHILFHPVLWIFRRGREIDNSHPLNDSVPILCILVKHFPIRTKMYQRSILKCCWLKSWKNTTYSILTNEKPPITKRPRQAHFFFRATWIVLAAVSNISTNTVNILTIIQTNNFQNETN